MLDAIEKSSLGASSPQERGKLRRATEDFESMLLADLLKSGPKMGTVDGSPESGRAEGYRELPTEAVASAMASHGGIGIGRMLLTQLAYPELQVRH